MFTVNHTVCGGPALLYPTAISTGDYLVRSLARTLNRKRVVKSDTDLTCGTCGVVIFLNENLEAGEDVGNKNFGQIKSQYAGRIDTSPANLNAGRAKNTAQGHGTGKVVGPHKRYYQ